MARSHIQFNYKGKQIKFTIDHNMPNTFGSSIENAIETFVSRNYLSKTPEGFISYIKSKGFEARLIK